MSEPGGNRGRGAGPPKVQGPPRANEPQALPGLGSVEAQRQRAAAEIDQKLKAWRKRGEESASAAGQSTPMPTSAGAALRSDVRGRMEPGLGADLSGVKVHT